MSHVPPQPHHIRDVESDSRPMYRRGRRATAVKAFTIADESQHVLVFGVPAVNLLDELTRKAEGIGEVTVCKVINYPDLEEFTELYHLHFKRIAAARTAKKHFDGLEFFGGLLHVCYAPELETLEETRDKLIQRSKMVSSKISGRTQKAMRGFDS